VIRIEDAIRSLPGVHSVSASLVRSEVSVSGDFNGLSEEKVMKIMNEALQLLGYVLTLTKKEKIIDWSEFQFAIPIAAAFLVVFVLLQKMGIVQLVSVTQIDYRAAFVIGLIASVSTCMAIVGGLVLSMSASFAKEGDRVRPQIYFHAGRIYSFAVLGGVIGSLGSAFQLGATATFTLGMIIAVVLLLLGINLLDVLPSVKRFQPTMPSVIGKRLLSVKNMNHSLTPLLVGGATFFLPCGFTQSMQIYALSTGSYWAGSLIMFAFALGTLPVLSLLSFSSLSIHSNKQSGVFFKTVGLITICFGLLNLLNALAGVGIIAPIFNL